MSERWDAYQVDSGETAARRRGLNELYPPSVKVVNVSFYALKWLFEFLYYD